MSGISEKLVYFEPAGRIHPSQWPLIDYPPEGYKFTFKKSRGIVNNNFVFDKLRLQVLDRLMPLNMVKSTFDTISNFSPNGACLQYLYNHTTVREIPWVVSVEWAHILVGRELNWFNLNKRTIERHLKTDYCKAILPWSEMVWRSMLLNYDCTGLGDKMHIIYPAAVPVDYTRDYDRGRVRLFFLGALKDPASFDAKGGWEVVKVFLALKNKYPKLELTIRSGVPRYLREELAKVRGVRLLESALTDEELDNEFKEADIFIVPSHKLHNMAVFDAMRFGLPIVTTQIGATNGEFVENEVTGLVVDSPSEIPYITGNYILTSETVDYGKLIKAVRKYRHKNITQLVKATEALIVSPSLREALGSRGKQEVESGRFSLSKRNKELKEIFDYATG